MGRPRLNLLDSVKQETGLQTSGLTWKEQSRIDKNGRLS